MTTMKQRVLIVTATALATANKAFSRAYDKAMFTLHTLFISNLIHACEHGDPSTLNAFYAGLRTNDATAVRLYLGRLTCIVGGWDGIEECSAEQMAIYREQGTFIAYKDKAFHIVPNEVLPYASDNCDKVVALAGAMLNPDGKVWREVTERNNLVEVKTVGDEAMATKLANLIKEARGGKKNTTSEVSAKVIDALVAAQKTVGMPTTTIGRLI